MATTTTNWLTLWILSFCPFSLYLQEMLMEPPTFEAPPIYCLCMRLEHMRLLLFSLFITHVYGEGLFMNFKYHMHIRAKDFLRLVCWSVEWHDMTNGPDAVVKCTEQHKYHWLPNKWVSELVYLTSFLNNPGTYERRTGPWAMKRRMKGPQAWIHRVSNPGPSALKASVPRLNQAPHDLPNKQNRCH